MDIDRRRFLRAAGALSLPLLAAGCGFATGGSGPEVDGDTLSFTTWGTDAELEGFRNAVARFEQENPGSRIALNAVPYENFFTNIDAQLQSGNAPDVFRVDYDNLGTYAGRDQLLDLSPFLDPAFGDRFTPAMWRAVQNGDRPFGVPHHTDTSVILYDVEALASAGITTVPTSLEQAWTWEEFDQVAQTLRAALPADRYPFVYNWQATGVTRWLSWLFEADGRFLAEDLVTPAIDSAAGRAAIDFTKGFFERGLVPPNSSVKSTTYASDTWYSRTAAMTFAGAFLIPDAESTLDFEWGATFSPRNVRAGGDLGGNALVATAGSTKGELAAKFLDLVTQQEPMRDFCARASLLPTRQDLVDGGIEFAVRPELSPVFVGQASTVRPEDAAQVASPAMAGINTVLADQLELAFVGGQSTDDTLAGITAGITDAVSRAR